MSDRHSIARSRRIIVLIVATLAFGILAAAGLIAFNLREEALAKAGQDNRRLATVLAAQTERSLQAVDLVLRDIASEAELQKAQTPEQFRSIMATRSVYEKFVSRLSGLPQVAWLSAVNADGTLANMSLAWPPLSFTVTDRPYFGMMRQDGAPEIGISEPVVSRANGTWMMLVMRRISAPDGRFLGMLTASVQLAYLNAFYADLGLPPGMRISMMRRDGVVLTSFPVIKDMQRLVMPPSSAWHRTVAEGGGAYWGTGLLDGEPRLLSTRPVNGFPIVLNVGITEAALLAQWWNELAEIGGIVICAVGGLAALLRVLLTQFGKLETARDELAAFAAFNQTIVENIPLGIQVYREDGQCILANSAATRLAGAPAESMRAQNLRALVSWRDSGMLEAALAALADGIPRILDIHNEAPFSGKPAWMNARFSQVPIARVVHLLVISDDITERKLLEAQLEKHARELQKRERHLRSVLDNMPSLIGCWDLNKRNKFANHAYLDWFGINEALIPGKHIRDVIGETNYQLNLPHIEAALRGEPQVFERAIPAPDGSKLRYSLACYVPEMDAGEIQGFYALVSDITILKETEQALRAAMEEAEQANRAKSRFLATISHEIRTPINGVIGLAELLVGTKLNEQQRLWADRLLACADHLLRIVDDILDFSRLEAGQMQFDTCPFDAVAVAREAFNMLEATARAKALDWHLVLPDTPLPVLLGDPARLRQVLLNLLGNAIKFTQAGGVILTIRPGQIEADHVEVAFVVQDTGIGIPEEARQRLFQEFSQVDGSISRRFGGSGLGLAICDRLVKRMNGAITLESRLGEGSRFSFSIRLPAASPALEPASPPPPVPGVPLRILLADDDPTNREVTSAMLRRLGHEAVTATTGRAALTEARNGKFDVILMDAMMPEMDGLEAARAIRMLDGPVSHVRIIALTACVSPDDEQRCRAAGMDDFLPKPIRLVALEAKLGRAVATEPAETGFDLGAMRLLAAELGEPAYAEIRDQFLAELDARTARLEDLAASGQRDVMRREAHSLKSSAAAFGLTDLAALAAEVENEALSGSPETNGQWVVRLRSLAQAAPKALALALEPPAAAG